MVAYRDMWGKGKDSYLHMMWERLVLMKQLLSPQGSIYLHCDDRTESHLRAILDEIFGVENFNNSIVWKRPDSHNDAGQGAKFYGRIHDHILFYSNGENYTWNQIYGPLPEATIDKWYRNIEEETGRRYNKADLTARKAGGDTRYEWNGVTPPPGRYWAYSYEKMQKLDKEGRIVYSSSGKPYMKCYLD
jgi:adenine specific DNA methylase Mod